MFKRIMKPLNQKKIYRYMFKIYLCMMIEYNSIVIAL